MKSKTDVLDYQERESLAVEAIKRAIPKRFKKDMLPSSKGMFTELYRTKECPKSYVSSAVDGVGTKVTLASAMGIYHTVGIDCVAMAANDKAAHPGNGHISPFLYMCYLACQDKIEKEGLTENIMTGVVDGLTDAEASSVTLLPICLNLGKGETASLQEIIAGPIDGYGFDLAGAMVGFMPKNRYIPNRRPRPGQEIIAFQSSGAHSNGYTDLRTKVLKGDFEQRKEFRDLYEGRFLLDDKMPAGDITIGEEMLKPTRIYTKPMAGIASEGIPVIGINNTGYGLHNFNRVGKGVKYSITKPFEPQDIFKLMQEESGFDDKKMYRKFNMGMGFFVICDGNYSDSVIGWAKEFGIHSARVGNVEKYDQAEPVVSLSIPGKKGKPMIFRGY